MVHRKSSFARDGLRSLGLAVKITNEVVCSEPMPAGTLAQHIKLIALTTAFELGEGKKINVYTDSLYGSSTANIHGAIYKESGPINNRGKDNYKEK